MIRTQIQLTDEQAAQLRRAAAERGVSLATIIREAVDRLLASGEALSDRDRALSAVGGFRSGHHDIAEDHDRYLADDFDQ